MGGSRGLMHLRTILQGIKVQVLAHQICIADSSRSFNEKGGLVEPSFDEGTRMLGSQVAHQIKEAATSAALRISMHGSIKSVGARLLKRIDMSHSCLSARRGN